MTESEIFFNNDGEAQLSINYDESVLGKGAVSLTVSNGGGFSSVYLNFENLKDMAAQINKFLKDVTLDSE